MKTRIAVSPPSSALHEDVLGDYLSECEHLGFDTVWLSDIPLGAFGDPILSLTYAAAVTSKLKLGANIVPLGRNPLWLAKQLAQLDRMSHGRLLLSFVPGLGAPAERAALGYPTANRGQIVDDMITLMRRWWAGETVTQECCGLTFEGIALEPLPAQQPLEVWLGGKAPAALKRVARIADGWLTSVITPLEAERARVTIERHAVEFGREVDAEHFGISIPCARQAPPESAVAALRVRREDRDLSEVVAVGDVHLKQLIEAHQDAGLSKFVVRTMAGENAPEVWQDDLRWLADAVLPLQT
jgi:probable F420-dependent oxidoreductase